MTTKPKTKAPTRRRSGRPSLTGHPVHSPQVAFRVTPRLLAKAEHLAAQTGQTLSQMARTALAAWLAQMERGA